MPRHRGQECDCPCHERTGNVSWLGMFLTLSLIVNLVLGTGALLLFRDL